MAFQSENNKKATDLSIGQFKIKFNYMVNYSVE